MVEEAIITRAIKKCLAYRMNAKTIKDSTTKVGACIYTATKTFGGYNIQNETHRDYHAEEIASINYLLSGENPTKALGIVVSFSKDDFNKLTFCCGHCRQVLWEVFRNPDFLVIEANLEGNIILQKTLSTLYPFPYPNGWRNTSSNT